VCVPIVSDEPENEDPQVCLETVSLHQPLAFFLKKKNHLLLYLCYLYRSISVSHFLFVAWVYEPERLHPKPKPWSQVSEGSRTG
jgi:hypothetical protein